MQTDSPSARVRPLLFFLVCLFFFSTPFDLEGAMLMLRAFVVPEEKFVLGECELILSARAF
jgi:hypothetical protein